MSLLNSKDTILPLGNLKYDLPAGLVVFLVALPLCLGISLASGAPLFAGIITGVIGGIVVAIFSGSQLSVSGPAAGLTVIVLNGITTLGDYRAFLLAVVLSGVIQIILGIFRAGSIGYFFPSSVIKGMLAAIGIILILKQIPHAIGYDVDPEGDLNFFQWDHENTFTEIFAAFKRTNTGAIIISAVSILILIFWDKIPVRKLRLIPAGLLVVVFGILINRFFHYYYPSLYLSEEHLVELPVSRGINEFMGNFMLPDFSYLMNPDVYIIAITLAIVASLETLLSIEAVDKIDPFKRSTPNNRELRAQGIGNILSGMIGGIPMTAVIVRSSANVSAGGRTKTSAFLHGVFLLTSVIVIPDIMNMIPLSALAAILLLVGYKLAKVSLFKEQFKQGTEQFAPFVVTVLAIVLTDLLKGIFIGMIVAVYYILKRNLKNPYVYKREEYEDGHLIRMVLSEEVSFLNKASILDTLNKLPVNSRVIIDGSQSKYIDNDVIEIINDFKVRANYKNIDLTVVDVKEDYSQKAKENGDVEAVKEEMSV